MRKNKHFRFTYLKPDGFFQTQTVSAPDLDDAWGAFTGDTKPEETVFIQVYELVKTYDNPRYED